MRVTAHSDTFALDNLPPRSQWPELIFELPELRYARHLNCAAELLDRAVARGDGERVVIRAADGSARTRSSSRRPTASRMFWCARWG